MTAITWSDDRVEQLKKLWEAGLSASQIASKMGGVTRNAVIGKVHRLGLSGRATPAKPQRGCDSEIHEDDQHRAEEGDGLNDMDLAGVDRLDQLHPETWIAEHLLDHDETGQHAGGVERHGVECRDHRCRQDVAQDDAELGNAR